MNSKNIDRLMNSMKFGYERDCNGVSILNKSLCFKDIYEKFLSYEDGYAVFDFSKSKIESFYPNLNFMLVSLDEDSLRGADFPFPFYLIEYFKLGEKLLPLAHCYNYISYKIWRLGSYSNKCRLCIDDYSKIIFRIPNVDGVEALNASLVKPISKKTKTIEFSIIQFKCWKFIEKSLKGIECRERWVAHNGDFPSIHVRMKDGSEFVDHLDILVSVDEIYCKHPSKDHIEYFFSAERKHKNERNTFSTEGQGLDFSH